MGDPRAAPGFGQIDLEIEDEPGRAVSTDEAFGQLDWDLGPEADEPPPPPPSTSRVFNNDGRATRRNLAAQSAPPPSVHDESTRVVSGDALAAATRPPGPLDDDGSTRAWADVDEALLAIQDEAEPPPSSRGQLSSPSPSGSGVAARDDRVAAMRELYARGDADGAAALGATLSIAPASGGHDHPDASIYVEFGEQSIDLSDPFGGLIPLDDDLAAMPAVGSWPAPATAFELSPSMPPPSGPAANLTLTERQSIPCLLKSMAEVSKLKIDHRAGFLLAHVDGMHTLEEILDICAMPTAEALDLIANLREMGVIEFE